jgi:hypothetical protein
MAGSPSGESEEWRVSLVVVGSDGTLVVVTEPTRSSSSGAAPKSSARGVPLRPRTRSCHERWW